MYQRAVRLSGLQTFTIKTKAELWTEWSGTTWKAFEETVGHLDCWTRPKEVYRGLNVDDDDGVYNYDYERQALYSVQNHLNVEKYDFGTL
jgi:hypothetical protein